MITTTTLAILVFGNTVLTTVVAILVIMNSDRTHKDNQALLNAMLGVVQDLEEVEKEIKRIKEPLE